jgi:protein-tyrosine phosphatase
MTDSATISTAAIAAFATISTSFTPPSPPFINVEGVANFRDIGGYAVTDAGSGSSPSGSVVRRGFIFRSALPTKITPRGVKTLVEDLRVRTIYDLRSAIETRKAPLSSELFVLSSTPSSSSPVQEIKVEVHHVPVVGDTEINPEQLARRSRDQLMSSEGTAGFVAAYADILTYGVHAYRRIFSHIRDRPHEPLLIHCAGGKDRTGVLAALILLAAGVTDRDVVASEYALTEQGFDPALRPVFVEAMLKNPLFEGRRDAVERMLSAKKENLVATLEWLDEAYGGVRGYLTRGLGFADEEVEMIRKNLVVEGGEYI